MIFLLLLPVSSIKLLENLFNPVLNNISPKKENANQNMAGCGFPSNPDKNESIMRVIPIFINNPIFGMMFRKDYLTFAISCAHSTNTQV